MALQQTLGAKLSVFRLEVLYLRPGRLSKVSLSQIRKTVQSFCNHQRRSTVFLHKSPVLGISSQTNSAITVNTTKEKPVLSKTKIIMIMSSVAQ